MTITTLDDLKAYFAWLKTQPLPTGPHESEANLLPILEAFGDWGEIDIAELFVQLGLTLCIKRGEAGKAVMQEACLTINETLLNREYVRGRVN